MAYTWVSASAAQNEGASPLIATYAQTPAQGNLMVASARRNSQTGTPTLSDSNGNWTLITSTNFSSSTDSLYLFAKIATASQPTAITIAGTGTWFLSVEEFNWSGGAIPSLTGLVDTSAVTNSGASSSLTTAGSQPSVTTTNANDLLYSVVGFSSTVTTPTWTGATIQQQVKAGLIEMVDGYQAETTTGILSPSLAWLSSRLWGQITVAFLPPVIATTTSSTTQMLMGI
jgi:hypothetical protein